MPKGRFFRGIAALIVALGLIFFGVMLSDSLSRLVQDLLGVSQTETPKKDALEFIGLGIGGLIALWGVVSLSKRADAQEETNKLQQTTIQLQEEGLFQERFKAAVDHLASDQEAGRIASFYELLNLARSRLEYRQNVLNILCAHMVLISNAKDRYSSHEFRALVFNLLSRDNNNNLFSGLNYSLQGINLRGHTMSGISFASPAAVDFRLAILDDAKLPKAQFAQIMLSGASFENTILAKANLKGTDLSEAKFLETATLTRAKYDANTEFPDGFEPEAHGMIKED